MGHPERVAGCQAGQQTKTKRLDDSLRQKLAAAFAQHSAQVGVAPLEKENSPG